MKEYKVVTQADRWFTLGLNASSLEAGLNEAAVRGWEVKAILHGEHLGWLGTRGGMAVVLERERVLPPPPKVVDVEQVPYDAALIPADRYYKDLGRITSALKEAKLVDESGLQIARDEMAKRGGHICDHLLAIGAITDERLRQFCREHYEMNV